MFPLKDDIPTRRFPVVTVAIIGICCAVYFLFEQGLWSLGVTGDERVLEFGAIPYEITNPGSDCGFTADGSVLCEGQPEVGDARAPEQAAWYVTVFTSMFMHGSLVHLGGNMLFLWIFGNNVEDRLGRVTFVALYVLGGLAATAFQVGLSPNSAVPNVGASGAIAAILGAYLVLFPRARIHTLVIFFFITFLELPASFVLLAWFVLQLFSGVGQLGSQVGGGVAYWAHVGGFVFGMAVAWLFFRSRGRQPPYELPPPPSPSPY